MPIAYMFAMYTSLEGHGVWLGCTFGGLYITVGMVRLIFGYDYQKQIDIV